MEMNSFSLSRLIHTIMRSQVLFFLIAAVVWHLAISRHFTLENLLSEPPGGISGRLIIFSLSCALTTFFISRALGYFDRLRVLPRKSDLLLLLVGTPMASSIVITAFHLFAPTSVQITANSNQISSVFLMIVFVLSPLIAVLTFCSHYIITLAKISCGYRRKVVLNVTPEEKALLFHELRSYGVEKHFQFLSKQDLKEYLLRRAHQDVGLIIISRSTVNHFEEDALLVRAHLGGIPIMDFGRVFTTLTGRVRLLESDLWSYVIEATPQTAPRRAFSAAKIVLEPIMAICLGIVLSPIMVTLALAIRYTSKGPIFYKQVRTGYLGRNFTLVKFRSMRVDAESDGPQWATNNDTRVTPLGRFLRATRLDELPQLWNVIRGEMGFFGPRPERPEIYRALKKEIPLFSMRTVVRPGITGWAQVFAGYAASINESRTKLEFDLFYIQNMSPRLDLIVLTKTLQVAIFGDKSGKRPVEAQETLVAKES